MREDVGLKPGSCALPLPGFDVRSLDAATGAELPRGTLGSLAAKLPLPPGAMQSLYNNEARFRTAYLDEFEGYHSLGDAGFVDEDGYVHVMVTHIRAFRIHIFFRAGWGGRAEEIVSCHVMRASRARRFVHALLAGTCFFAAALQARTDDVINVSGVRLSTGALEEVLSAHPAVAECAVVGARCDLRGQVPLGLLVLTNDASASSASVVEDVIRAVRRDIGPIASFRLAAVVSALPKTRSGKTLRGTLRSPVSWRLFFCMVARILSRAEFST